MRSVLFGQRLVFVQRLTQLFLLWHLFGFEPSSAHKHFFGLDTLVNIEPELSLVFLLLVAFLFLVMYYLYYNRVSGLMYRLRIESLSFLELLLSLHRLGY